MAHSKAASCQPGTLDLELVSVSGTDAAIHPFAKCFNSLTVSVDADCNLGLATTSTNNFVQSLWSAAQTYSQVKACPTTASLAFTDATVATSETGLASLLTTSIYAEGVTASVSAASGVVTLTSTYLTNEATLKFRSSAITGSATGIFNTVDAPSCSTAVECAATSTGCGAGLYSVPIGTTGTFVCGLCSSGSYSAAGATSCTATAAGRALPTVGAASDTSTACSAGTFSTLGSSDCQPCAPGTYQNAPSSSSCTSCPSTWSSHIYGATQCIKCTNGRPAVCTGAACTSNTGAGSSGSFTASVANDGTWTTATGWPATYSYPDLFGTCSPASTLLAFTVSANCSMEIRALAVTATTTNGKACSDPTNTASNATAYYTGVTTIMSKLSGTVPKGNILKIVNAASTTVTLSVTAATSYPIAPTGTVTGVLTVNGGDLAGADGGATCPSGTYKTGSDVDNTLSCTACAIGSYCTSGTSTSCAAGTYSNILGQSVCSSCAAGTYAASTGSSQCLTCASPYVVGGSGTTCDCGATKKYNSNTNACDCAPGYRASGSDACTICPVNTYSSGGPTSVVVAECTACPSGQVSAAGSETCGTCPTGQAKIGDVCSRCPAGNEPRIVSPNTYATCVPCGFGYYNPSSGGTAQFDACQICGDGKKTDVGKTTCTNCAAGTYSIWTSLSVRVPADDPSTCATCSDGSFSVAGESKCILCAGGAQANAAKTSCEKCIAGTFRDFTSNGGCIKCPAGTFSKTAAGSCTMCKPGEFSAEGAEICSDCAANTYSIDFGSTTCIPCAAGSTTAGATGAKSCNGCPVGTHYNSTTKLCDDCEIGEYQDREGQNICKKCPIGTFSETTKSATCDRCPAGQYNPVGGSGSCRICPGGTFSASGGQGSCSICAKGKYSSPGAVACTRCSAGFYANKYASRSCTPCPRGSKCPGVANSVPTLCPAGSFQSKPGQINCRVCPKKTYVSKAGSSRCVRCSTAINVGTAICPSPSRRKILLTRLDMISLK